MRNVLILGAAALMLTGCALYPYSEAPIAKNFETTKQLKLQAGQHWQAIADDMATSLTTTMAKGTACVAPAGGCPSLYVAPPVAQSAFSRAFHTQLISHLVNKGLNVVAQAPGTITVSIDAQTVKFSPDRRQYKGAGNFTMLTAGLWAIRDLSVYHDAPGAAVLGAAVLGDITSWNDSEYPHGKTPQIELILTASATKGGQFLARTTNVYYIADSDASLYCWKAEECFANTPKVSATPELRVVGDCGSSPYCIAGGGK